LAQRRVPRVIISRADLPPMVHRNVTERAVNQLLAAEESD